MCGARSLRSEAAVRAVTRGMRTGCLLLLLCCLIEAGDKQPYPKRHSTQTHKGRRFELLIPEDFDARKDYSLMFVVGGDTGKFTDLLDNGFIICASRPRTPGKGWATSEAKELHNLLDHLGRPGPRS